MRIILKLMVCAAVMTASMSAATFNHVNGGVWSTGFDAGGGILSGGSADPHYTLIYLPQSWSGGGPCQTAPNGQCQVTAGDNFGPETYVVLGSGFPIASGSWIANDANSTWIGQRPDMTNTLVGGTLGGPSGVNIFASNTDAYVYRMVFNLTALGLNPSTASIQLAWASDNRDNAGGGGNSHIRLCSINSAADPFCSASFTVPGSGNAGQDQPLTAVTINSSTCPGCIGSGLMAIDFVVFNSEVLNGYNPSGLRVDILSATTDADVPEPATLSLIGLGMVAVACVRRRQRYPRHADQPGQSRADGHSLPGRLRDR